MHYALITTLIFSSSLAFAKIQKVDYFYDQSKKLQQTIKEKDSVQNKAKTLQKLEAEFAQTLKEYKKKYAKESSAEEDKVSLLFFTMEPTFNLAKKTAWDQKDCERTEVEIRSGDAMGREENAATTPQAGEALAWLKILCAK
jgi:biopolymer transport protein ExbB/TolQ